MDRIKASHCERRAGSGSELLLKRVNSPKQSSRRGGKPPSLMIWSSRGPSTKRQLIYRCSSTSANPFKCGSPLDAKRIFALQSQLCDPSVIWDCRDLTRFQLIWSCQLESGSLRVAARTIASQQRGFQVCGSALGVSSHPSVHETGDGTRRVAAESVL